MLLKENDYGHPHPNHLKNKLIQNLTMKLALLGIQNIISPLANIYFTIVIEKHPFWKG